MVSSFEETVLPVFIDIIRDVLKQLAVLANGTQDREKTIVITLAIDVFYKILSYPFGLSYYEYTVDVSSDEITIILYPDLYFSTMEDRELLQALVRLMELKISKDVSLNLLYVFNKMVACRLSLFNTDEDRIKHKTEYSQLFPLLVAHSPTDDRKFLAELVEFGLKAFYVFSARFVMQNTGIANQWAEAWNTIGLQVVLGSTSFVDPVLTRYFDYLKRWQEYDSSKSKELITGFFELYLRHFFQNARQDFFPEEFLSAKKFTKCVEKRLGVLRDFYLQNCSRVGKMLEQLA